MSTTIINAETKMGGYRYPFISDYFNWHVVTTKFELGKRGQKILKSLLAKRPTLRIVKDDGVTDIYLPKGKKTMKMDQALEEMGIKILQPTHPQTGKRLSRVFRPSLAFGVFTKDEMPVYEIDWDNDLWDAAFLIGRESVRYLTLHLPWQVQEAFERCFRFEATILTEKGQIKGHALVIDGNGIWVPKGCEKTQIAFTKGVFVDLRPVKAHNHLLADIQTIINHYHLLFDNRTLMRWLQAESEKKLEELEKGEIDITGIMQNIYDEREFEQLMSFPVFEFLASGGKLHQSPYMTRQWGKMWARKLESKSLYGHRMPIPCGFRLYLTAAAVGDYRLKPGEALIKFKTASIYVSDKDYIRIAKTLGGGDQDDAVNIITDGHTAMLTRNPNMRGEYELVTLVNPEELEKHGVKPCKINWDKLKKIPAPSERKYGELYPLPVDQSITDYPAFANWVMEGVAERLGVLGTHINVLAACTLTDGDEPMEQPARGEPIIDATVKDLTINLDPVMDWDEEIAKGLINRPLCRDAQRRLARYAPEDHEFKNAKNHWLDNLEKKVEAHIEWFLERVQNLADKATPPAAAYQAVKGNQFGKGVVGVYNSVIKQAYLSGEPDEKDFEEARKATLAYLRGLPDPHRALLEAWTLTWGSDAAIWQKEISTMTFKALRDAGILSPVSWDGYGVVAEEKSYPRTVHVQINGSWFEGLKAKGIHFNTMNDVPKPQRNKLKYDLMANAHLLVGRKVSFQKEGDRIVAISDIGKRMGVVARDHEGWAKGTMTVVYATAFDGNFRLVLE